MMKMKIYFMLLIFLGINIFIPVSFAATEHLSTNPNAKPYVYHLSTNLKKDTMPLPANKSSGSSQVICHQKTSSGSNEIPVVVASPTALVPSGPGTCVTFINGGGGNYNKLYNRCGRTPGIVDETGKIKWVFERYVEINCNGKIFYYTIDRDHVQGLPAGVSQTECVIISDLPCSSTGTCTVK